MDDSNSVGQEVYIFAAYYYLAHTTDTLLLAVKPLMVLVSLLVILPVLACMNCRCKARFKKIYKFIDKTVTFIFPFLTRKKVKDDEEVSVSRFIVFGYVAPPVFTYYVFFLCVVTLFDALAAFLNGFLIDVTNICNPYDEYDCFTVEGELVSKPLERPSNSSQLTCFNQTTVNCFKFMFDTEEGVTMAASLLTFSWVIILCLLWLILKCSGGRGPGCFLPCFCCPKGRFWCSCGRRCIITVLLQVAVFIIPQNLILLPHYSDRLSLAFKNYFDVDTTGEFLAADTVKLLHISSILTYGVLVPWCWFKRELPGHTNLDGEEEEVTRNQGQRQEEGDPPNEQVQGPTQVCVSNTGQANEIVQTDPCPV